MKPSEVLRAAREKIATPEKWTRGVEAKNACGDGVSAFSHSAVGFCIIGALSLITSTYGDEQHDYCAATRYLRLGIGEPVHSLSLWNDAPERTHVDVIDAFTKAIAIAEAEWQ